MAKKQYKRSDGRYARSVYIGRDDGGKRQYKTVYGSTPQEVEKAVVDLRSKLHKGINIDAEHATFGEWADRWLRMKAVNVGVKQLKNYTSCTKYFKDEFGAIPISRVQSTSVQDALDRIAVENPTTHRPSAKKTIEAYRDTVLQIFDYAISFRSIEYNPARVTQAPKNAPKSHRRALTEDEQKWIVETPHRARRAAMIMMYAGLRLGELIPLTWADVDVGHRTISVNKTVYEEGSRYIIKPTAKTEASLRTVDIPKRLADFLAEEKASEKPKKTEKVLQLQRLVCPSASGNMMSPKAWRTLWKSYLTELNFKYGNRIDRKGGLATSKYNRNGIEKTIPPITAHWLRHTFATLLYLAGVDVLVAKTQLGHADIKTTLAIYTHLDSTHKRSSMAKLDAYLDPETVPCKSNASQ